MHASAYILSQGVKRERGGGVFSFTNLCARVCVIFTTRKLNDQIRQGNVCVWSCACEKCSYILSSRQCPNLMPSAVTPEERKCVFVWTSG